MIKIFLDSNVTAALRATTAAATIISTCLLTLLSASTLAQDADWQSGRTIDGHPDLQGVWANNTITPD
jgi:hypothetical protein